MTESAGTAAEGAAGTSADPASGLESDTASSLLTINETLTRLAALLAPAQPSQANRPEIEEFVAQARWLIATHSARSDSFQNRAGAFLGFAGVLLGLILTALTSGNVPKSISVTIIACFTISLLLAASIFMLSVLWVVRVSLPGVTEIRTSWHSYIDGTLDGFRSRGMIANSLLGSHPPGESAPVNTNAGDLGGFQRALLGLKRELRRLSGPTCGLDPLTAAKKAADAQGVRLKCGVATLFAAFLSTGAMIITIAT